MKLQHLRISDTPAPAQTTRAALEEEVADGKVHDEYEYVWYGRVRDFSVIKDAFAFEHQRQSFVLMPHGLVRVRKTIKDGVVSYVETTKLFLDNGGRKEFSEPCSALKHEFFMRATGVSMDKTRYSFRAGGGLTWEIDLFTDLNGNFKPYCKVDLETNGPLDHLPELPIALEDMIFVDPTKGRPDAATQERIDALNKRMFVNKV